MANYNAPKLGVLVNFWNKNEVRIGLSHPPLEMSSLQEWAVNVNITVVSVIMRRMQVLHNI